MPWVKLDDGFWSDPDIDQLSLAAVGVFCKGLSFCGQHLTDGHIPNHTAAHLTYGDQSLVDELLAAGLWRRRANGFLVPKFLDYNPSKKQVEEQRQRSRERQEKARQKREKPESQNGSSADHAAVGVSK